MPVRPLHSYGNPRPPAATRTRDPVVPCGEGRPVEMIGRNVCGSDYGQVGPLIGARFVED